MHLQEFAENSTDFAHFQVSVTIERIARCCRELVLRSSSSALVLRLIFCRRCVTAAAWQHDDSVDVQDAAPHQGAAQR